MDSSRRSKSSAIALEFGDGADRTIDQLPRDDAWRQRVEPLPLAGLAEQLNERREPEDGSTSREASDVQRHLVVVEVMVDVSHPGIATLEFVVTDVHHQGIRPIGQAGQFLVHRLEDRPAFGPHVDCDRAARKDLFQPPGDDLGDREPGVVRLAAAARLSDHQNSQGPSRLFEPVVWSWNRVGQSRIERVRRKRLDRSGRMALPATEPPADRGSRSAAPARVRGPGLKENEAQHRGNAEKKQPRRQEAFP